MNEQRYQRSPFECVYTGILTSPFSNGKFKMELKVEDDQVVSCIADW